MTSFRRQALSLAAAVALPLLVMGGYQLYSGVNVARKSLEAMSRSRAEEVQRLVDTQILAEIKLARTLASSSPLRRDDASGVLARADEIAGIAQSWRGVRIWDADTGQQLAKPGTSADANIAPPVDAALIARSTRGLATVGDIETAADGRFVVPVHAPILRDGRLRYIVTVAVDPASIQQLVMSRFPTEGLVSAVVDRRARFIARSLSYDQRLGKSGAPTLREAVARGGHGEYLGVTLEGAQNFTAYRTSTLTGWSTHVAVPYSPFASARTLSLMIGLAVIVGALLLSAVIVLSTLKEIAEGRQEAERLRQSQKMEAVGHLTGGIAHDFNNLLTAIIGGLDLVLLRMDPSDRNHRFILSSLEAAQRGARLTSRLLAFSRTQNLGLEPVDVAATLHGMSDLLHQALGASVTVDASIPEAGRWVMTDRSQLEMAFLNLAMNARDAMPAGGKLSIVSRLMPSDGNAQARVEICVSDTGVGMPSEVRERAFDPFFTTKAVDKGTGLGLAQVYSLMRQSGGEVQIDSAEGQGTRVRMLFPRAARSNDAASQKPVVGDQARPSALADGPQILLVDDDKDVREVLAQSLIARGYQVSEAPDGETALRELSAVRPALLIVDFLMPGLNGADVARKARELRPTQKILIVSGHLDSQALVGLPDDVTVLPKPFDGESLAARVAATLATDGQSW